MMVIFFFEQKDDGDLLFDSVGARITNMKQKKHILISFFGYIQSLFETRR